MFQSRKLKAQQLHVGALYTLHDANSSEYESEIEDTFCFTNENTQESHISSQSAQTSVPNGQPSVPLTGTSSKKPVPMGQVRHLC